MLKRFANKIAEGLKELRGACSNRRYKALRKDLRCAFDPKQEINPSSLGDIDLSEVDIPGVNLSAMAGMGGMGNMSNMMGGNHSNLFESLSERQQKK